MKRKILEIKRKGDAKSYFEMIFKNVKAINSLKVGIVTKKAHVNKRRKNTFFHNLYRRLRGFKINRTKVLIADVAKWMEYGTPTIPARPFLRPVFRENKDRIRKRYYRMLKKLVKMKRIETRALEPLGEELVALVKDKIDSIFEPSLSDITVKRKGHGKPLIDTYQLRDNIGYRIN